MSTSYEHRHSTPPQHGLAALSLPEHQRWRRNISSGHGHFSCGWIFDEETEFDTIGLLEVARLAPVGRVKGVLCIREGLVRINRQDNDFHIETRPTPPPDSRIELLHDEPADWNTLQSALLTLRLA